MLILLLYVLVYGILLMFRRRRLTEAAHDPGIHLPDVFVDILVKADPVCMARMLHRDAHQYSTEDVLVLMSKSKPLLKNHAWNPTTNLHSLWYVGILCPLDKDRLISPEKETLVTFAETTLEPEGPVEALVESGGPILSIRSPEVQEAEVQEEIHVQLQDNVSSVSALDVPPPVLPASPKKKKARRVKE